MFKPIRFTFLLWDVSISFNSRWGLGHLKLHRTEFSKHLVWYKLSILIENWSLEVHPVCAECNSDAIGEVFSGDEGLTVCEECRAVERGYRYVNLREFNRLG